MLVFSLVMTPTAGKGKRAEAADAVWDWGPFSANPLGLPSCGLSYLADVGWVGMKAGISVAWWDVSSQE